MPFADVSMERLLQFEDRYGPSLMEWKADGLHLWPGMRTGLFMRIRERSLGLEQAHGGAFSGGRGRLLRRMAGSILAPGRNPYGSLPEADMAFLTNAAKRSWKRDGRNFDTGSDYFCSLLDGRGLILEEPYQGGHRPPEYTREIRYLDLAMLAGRVRAALPGSGRPAGTEAFVEEVRRCLEEFFPGADFLPEILKGYPLSLARMLCYSGEFGKIVRRSGCRVASIHRCAYGGACAFLAKRLRDGGITVAEFQHGTVSPEHPAYNYGTLPPGYAGYLPDYFLTYGDYWSEITARYPVKKVAVGNPFLEERLKAFPPDAGRGKRILVVSQGTLSSGFAALARDLRRLLPGEYALTFRLHPGEVPFRKSRFGEIEGVPGLEIQETGDVYSAIGEHGVIVGAYSTTIFEALPFGRRIFVWDTEMSRRHIPGDVGRWFRGAGDLAAMILSGEAGPGTDSRRYWAGGWEDRFRDFVRSAAGSAPRAQRKG